MKEEANLKTYLSISPNKFGIYLFDTKSFTYLYESEIEIENNFTSKDMDNLTRFLEDNVFNIEKLIGDEWVELFDREVSSVNIREAYYETEKIKGELEEICHFFDVN